jgi:hypothetical protein
VEESLVETRGLAPTKASADIAIPLKALSERIADTEAALTRHSIDQAKCLRMPPPLVEVAQELFIEIKGGKLHRQATRLVGTPPAFWQTTCGRHFAGSMFTFLSALEVFQSRTSFCNQCVAPARAGYGQVGEIMVRARSSDGM